MTGSVWLEPVASNSARLQGYLSVFGDWLVVWGFSTTRCLTIYYSNELRAITEKRIVFRLRGNQIK